MARSKGINIPVKLDTKATTKELKTLTNQITKSIGKINNGNKHLEKSIKGVTIALNKRNTSLKRTNQTMKSVVKTTNQQTIAINKQNTAIKNENRSLGKNTSAWKKNQTQQRKSKTNTTQLTSSTNKFNTSLGGMRSLALRGGIWGGLAFGLAKATSSMISASKEMENLETQFKAILGTRENAQKRMRELSKFASETPFKLTEVAKASRVLETLTKGALSTGEGLRLVGDVGWPCI